jgi:hypothetical protein
MRVRFLIDLAATASDRTYTATLLSITYPDSMPRALALEDARNEFAHLFGREAFGVPGVYMY